MIDTVAAKALLQSNDVNELRKASKEWVQYIDGSIATSAEQMDDTYKNQIMKLLILINSKLIQLTPQDDKINLAKSFYEIGKVWMLLGDPIKAIGQYNHSLTNDTNNVIVLLAAGDACCSAGNFDSAIDFFQRAIAVQQSSSLSSSNASIDMCTPYTKIATSYEHMAEFTKALSTLQQAVDILLSVTVDTDRSNYQMTKSSIYYQIGTIQEKIGNYKDATVSLAIAVDSMKLCYGENHSKTQEAVYLLEMSKSLFE
jgi:tetratricopeptide (TPR) repeat protein